MKVAKWFKIVLLIWALIALPVLVFASGFAGTDIMGMFDLTKARGDDIFPVLINCILLVLPLICAPLGIKRLN